MPSTQLVNVVVEELSKFGFKANGRYVNYSKNLSEADKSTVVPGARFEAEFYVSDTGKEYLNKVIKAAPVVAKAPVKVAAKVEAPKATAPAKSETMTKAEWQDKDRSQLIGGLSHDAAAIVAAMVTVEALDAPMAIERFKQLLDGLLAVRSGVK